MRYAVNKHGFIENVIIADKAQKAELEEALGAVLEDASVYGLQIGDLWVEGKGWTRNIDGEQVVLEVLHQEERSRYQALSDELEEQQAVMAILTGELDEEE